MKKKILSLVLVVAMLASMLVFAPSVGAAAAGTTAEISVGKVTATAGGSVDVDIVVTSTEPVYAFNFAVDYDKTKLSLPEKNAVTFDAGGAGQPDAIGGENADYAQTSPYRFIAWTTTDVNNPADATNGWVAATLHFDVAEDAIGDVVVSVCNTPVTFISRSAIADDNQAVETLTFKSGAVTVLPAGYAGKDIVTFPDSAWEIEDGYLYGVSEELAAYEGVVVIPSVIGGITVENIDPQTFEKCSLTAVVIPETVLSIGELAFHDCENLTEAYVMNGACVIGEHALGFAGGTYKRNNYQHDAQPVAGFTLHASADSEVEAYATDSGITFSTDVAAYVFTVNGASYLVGSTVQAPGVATTDDGKVVVGWNDGTKTYAPGAAMTLTEDTELTPVTIDAIKMNTGIQFKMGESIKDCKMRYTTDMKIADYNKLAELGTVTLGTIITPAKYVSMAGGLTKEALTQLAKDKESVIGPLVSEDGTGAGLTYIDVPASAANPFGKTTDTYTFAGSLAGFKNENVNTKNVVYAAAFYATVTIDEKTSFTIYSNFDLGANRSVGDAITAMTGAGVEGQLTKTEADTLRDLIAKN